MRISKVYTRTGDQGGTRLVGGQKTAKDDPRVEAYGTVDELNAVVGLVRTFNGQGEGPAAARLEEMLEQIQNDLFCVGTDLATPAADRWEGMDLVGDEEVGRLEAWIDALNEDLEPLTEFILPGGGPVGAYMHQARTVCRRAERRVVGLAHLHPDLNLGTLRYLNRLSDWLFVAGRQAARAHGEPEYAWRRPAGLKGGRRKG